MSRTGPGGRWACRGPSGANRLRAKRRGRAGVSWYIDETYVKVAGRWCYLYRAIDREGMLIDSMLSAHRDKHAARRFLRGLLQVAERKPLRITTDAHPAYRKAIRWIVGRKVRHRCNRYLNNWIEQDRRDIKQLWDHETRIGYLLPDRDRRRSSNRAPQHRRTLRICASRTGAHTHASVHDLLFVPHRSHGEDKKASTPMAPLYDRTIADAARTLREGSASAVELTESVLQRIADSEPELNAYITVTTDRAREQAARADRELQAGRDRGPLHGIPFGVKDLVDTAGIHTTGGSGFLRDRVPAQDAFVMTRLYAAGAVLVGKHNLHEFAAGTTSNNPHFGAVHNPWNLDYIPGGSSGGSAASVVVGSCLGAIASDTGGSLRTPASMSGVVGLKPTYGRVSCAGVISRCWSYDCVGPIAKTVADSALILNAIAAHDPHDPGSAEQPPQDYTGALDRGLDGLRVGVPRTRLWLDCDPEVAAACNAALDLMAANGATVEDVELPIPTEIDWTVVREPEAAAYHAPWMAAHAADYSPEIYANLVSATAVSAVAYINAQRARRQITDDTRALFQRLDVLVSPTNPSTAVPIDGPEPGFTSSRYTAGYNLTGIPAISVPCGFTAGGLPIGLMLAARRFDEVTLLRAAHAYEQLTDWHTRRPPI